MNLTKFGRTAVNLDLVAYLREVQDKEGNRTGVVVVAFERNLRPMIKLQGDDAREAIRYLDSLPGPRPDDEVLLRPRAVQGRSIVEAEDEEVRQGKRQD